MNTKRLLDISLAILLLIILFLPIIIFWLLVKITSKGPGIYWSDRVGRNNRIFKMPKLRTMKIDTPIVATHLLKNTESHITVIGSFIRKNSIDELPQLWSIIIGDMSFVGPRPALYNQYDLISLRKNHGVDKLYPGLTGWAQINGRDDLPVKKKVELDIEYQKKMSVLFDLKIIFLTLRNVIIRDGISH